MENKEKQKEFIYFPSLSAGGFASALIKVCFIVLSRTLLAGEKINIGGFELKTLKKLNGDKLGFPFSSSVLAKAMGLGATALCKYP